MTGSLDFEYLHAMGIPVWVMRGDQGNEALEPVSLRLGPGKGSVLLVCADAGETALPLAADIGRVLAEPPVWAWPDEPGAGIDLFQAVDENLFTSVVIFGHDLAGQIMASKSKDRVCAAKLICAPGTAELLDDGKARKVLWQLLTKHGLAAPV